jgi:hypothetical protein
MPEYNGPRRLKRHSELGENPWEGSSPYAWDHRHDDLMDKIDRWMNRLAVGTVIFAIGYFGAHVIYSIIR